jgi:hypothetical protein
MISSSALFPFFPRRTLAGCCQFDPTQTKQVFEAFLPLTLSATATYPLKRRKAGSGGSGKKRQASEGWYTEDSIFLSTIHRVCPASLWQTHFHHDWDLQFFISHATISDAELPTHSRRHVEDLVLTLQYLYIFPPVLDLASEPRLQQCDSDRPPEFCTYTKYAQC